MALAEGPATAAASPATNRDKEKSSRGLDAASSAQSRAACREAHKKATVGEVERLERSLTEVGPHDPLRRYGINQKIVSTVATKSSAGLKGDYVRALKSAASSMEEVMVEVLEPTKDRETEGLRKSVDLLHARLAQISAENGQMKVDLAELRTLVNDLVEKQCNSVPVPTPLETEETNEIEELRRQLLIQEARSSKVERASPTLAHEAKDGAPVPAPRKTKGAATVKTYAGPKKAATPATWSATSAAVPAGARTTGASMSAAAGATRSAPQKKPASTPTPSQPAKVGPGRSRETMTPNRPM
ncbi:uncharacterized protein LOC134200076 [Bombyx mori]|uniref:uncharacterized protein LOC134200076 n=1 Tax=Bombyx mori TaxID=7091 RepID=UPI002ED60FE6